ncbi:MAG TPA: tyrosine-type recombinase/integrase [Xanthobacteraceae bacterium]|nr:tyrosine-type recombinase/integrase [Xanthobacteraceae bacterium]
MPRKLPPFVERWRDRHGKLRMYFRKGKGPRIALPPSLGSDEFEAAYKAALSGESAAKRERRQPDPPGTIAALVTSYLRSSAYLGLRETTKTGYASRIEMLRTQHGHRTVAGLNRERIVRMLQPYASKPGAALSTLKMLRVLIRHAIDIGWLAHDPSLGIKRPKTNEIRSWTDAEIATFEQHWPIDSKQRLAFALMLYTGQRRSDVHRMTWADVKAGMIKVVQQKTGRKLTIPIHRALAEVLATAPRQHVTIITTAYGKPFTVDGFSQWIRQAIAAAGLPLECQPHGLRKAAGRRLAEAGCTAHEIMAILGHKTLAEAERYTRDADQARLAADAMAKLEGRKANTIAQTDPDGLGKTTNTDGNSM